MGRCGMRCVVVGLVITLAACGGGSTSTLRASHRGVTISVEVPTKAESHEATAATEDLRRSLGAPPLTYAVVTYKLGRQGEAFPIDELTVETDDGPVEFESLYLKISEWEDQNLTDSERAQAERAASASINEGSNEVAPFDFWVSPATDVGRVTAVQMHNEKSDETFEARP